jgi:hypothetical protein
VSVSNSPQISELSLPGAPSLWEAIGFAVVSGSFVVGEVTCRLGATEPSWGFAGADSVPNEICGIPATGAEPPPPSSGTSRHANGAFKIDHVVLVSQSPTKTKDELEAFGLVSKGARLLGSGSSRRAAVFFWSGELLIELVGPADEAPEATSLAQLWGVTFVADDFDRVAAIAGDLVSPTRDAVQPGRQIVTIDGAAGRGVGVAFITPHVKAG